MKNFLNYLTVLFICVPLAWSNTHPQIKTMPANLLLLDSYFSHHVAIAEKSTHKLHLFENNQGIPRYIKSYNAATGKRRGDKLVQGDHKTPEGIFLLQEFILGESLVERYGKEGEIYGAGAFVMNYPNPFDRLTGKTGGGIWLHSTNDNSRVDKGLDSRGCVVVVDEDLKDISKFLELNNTHLLVVQDLQLISEDNWNLYRQELVTFVESWLQSWANQDLENYLSFYDPAHFKDPVRGGFNAFRDHKQRVFQQPVKPKIGYSYLSLLRHQKTAVVTFLQEYNSPVVQDIGKKVLHLQRDKDFDWKIISETWSKIPEEAKESRSLAFTPSMRFFPE